MSEITIENLHFVDTGGAAVVTVEGDPLGGDADVLTSGTLPLQISMD